MGRIGTIDEEGGFMPYDSLPDDPKELRQMRPFDIDAALDHIFADNPDAVKRMQLNPNAVNVLVGLGMKIAGGAADPAVLRQKILDRI